MKDFLERFSHGQPFVFDPEISSNDFPLDQRQVATELFSRVTPETSPIITLKTNEWFDKSKAELPPFVREYSKANLRHNFLVQNYLKIVRSVLDEAPRNAVEDTQAQSPDPT